ncbi:hypothetical protein [Nocardia sp. R7R-8]|uniref:hypothetical protein n=1 Tax=Nocardia sp. R7R-8 TaxID=3459304 RepID=UPI00403DC28E
MMAHAGQEEIDRWELRAGNCDAGVVVEGVEHARWLLARHSGHGSGCRPFQDALSAVSVAMG